MSEYVVSSLWGIPLLSFITAGVGISATGRAAVSAISRANSASALFCARSRTKSMFPTSSWVRNGLLAKTERSSGPIDASASDSAAKPMIPASPLALARSSHCSSPRPTGAGSFVCGRVSVRIAIMTGYPDLVEELVELVDDGGDLLFQI